MSYPFIDPDSELDADLDEASSLDTPAPESREINFGFGEFGFPEGEGPSTEEIQDALEAGPGDAIDNTADLIGDTASDLTSGVGSLFGSAIGGFFKGLGPQASLLILGALGIGAYLVLEE